MRRYLILITSLCLQGCLGGIYAWSSFAASLHSDYGLSMGGTQAIFGLIITFFTLAMVPAGRLLERLGPRLVGLIGGLLFGSGFYLAGVVGPNLPGLLLSISVIAGCGIGFSYVGPIALLVRWFPERKGLVTGLAVAGFGAGAIVLSALIEHWAGQGKTVFEMFRLVGLCYGMTIIMASLPFRFPPLTPEQAAQTPLAPRKLMGDARFWLLALGIFAGTYAGLTAIGSLKSIGLSGGLPEELAVLSISALALGNASGRIIWGFLHDRLKGASIPLALLVVAVALALLLPSAKFGVSFLLVSALAGFGFGSCFVLYATEVAHSFGARAVGTVYPLVFLAYGLSGSLGPFSAGWLFDITKSYAPGLLIAAFLAKAAAVVYWRFALRKPKKAC